MTYNTLIILALNHLAWPVVCLVCVCVCVCSREGVCVRVCVSIWLANGGGKYWHGLMSVTRVFPSNRSWRVPAPALWWLWDGISFCTVTLRGSDRRTQWNTDIPPIMLWRWARTKQGLTLWHESHITTETDISKALKGPLLIMSGEVIHEHAQKNQVWVILNERFLYFVFFSLVWSGRCSVGKRGYEVLPCTEHKCCSNLTGAWADQNVMTVWESFL